MTFEVAMQLIAAYNRGFCDGYAVGTKEYADYEADMENMRNESIG